MLPPRAGPQAVLECICMDEKVLDALAMAQHFRGIDGTPPNEVLRRLKQGGRCPPSPIQAVAIFLLMLVVRTGAWVCQVPATTFARMRSSTGESWRWSWL
eukprot:COSAG01_NODE_817_length_13376_cov_2.970101_17_plen_100_part_00